MTTTQNKNTIPREPIRKTFSSLIEWRDMQFFHCDKELQEETIKILTERELLKPDGKPNNPKIEENARFFGASLAERLSTSRTVKIIGLSRFREIMQEYSAEKDHKSMYYFVVYMYGITRWRTPFNLQRMPVSTPALKSYMTYFCEEFCRRADEIIAEKSHRPESEGNTENDTSEAEDTNEESI